MMLDWKQSTWGEEISLEYGKSLRGYQDALGPVPVYGTNGRIGWTAEPLVQSAGVILGRKGAYRGVEFSHVPFYVIDTAYYIEPKAGAHARWLYYAIQHHKLGELDDGSPIPSTTRAAVYHLPLEVPDVAEQKRIASVLAAFDDKIEHNLVLAGKLEAAAQAVFKAWFVDFEPVNAKAAGAAGFPSMPAEVFAALPDSLVDGRPEGWEVVALPDAIDVNPKRKLKKGEEATCLEMKNMPTEGHAPDAWTTRPVGSGAKFQNGDTLVARITPCLENGKTAFVDFLDGDEVAWGSTEYIVLHPKEGLPELFAYFLARTQEFRDFAIQNMTGSSGRQRVAPTTMSAFELPVPPTQLASAFEGVAAPLVDLIRQGKAESRRLAATRDFLLPRLLSGEVRVTP